MFAVETRKYDRCPRASIRNENTRTIQNTIQEERQIPIYEIAVTDFLK